MTDTTDTLYLDAVLTPNRALSPKAFFLVMTIVAGVSFIAGAIFISMGAFPVLGFFGLDAVLIWLAFRHSFRAQRQCTEVRVSAETLSLRHRCDGKLPISVDLPSAFARVKLMRPSRKPSELHVSYQDQTWVIGRFLTPAERRSFSQALESALIQARNARYAT